MLLLLLLFFSFLPYYGGELYKWVDKKGIIHFTDDPSTIPEHDEKDVDIREMPEPEIIEKSKPLFELI